MIARYWGISNLMSVGVFMTYLLSWGAVQGSGMR